MAPIKPTPESTDRPWINGSGITIPPTFPERIKALWDEIWQRFKRKFPLDNPSPLWYNQSNDEEHMSFPDPISSCDSILIEAPALTAENTITVYQAAKSYTQTNALTKTAMITNSTHGYINVLHYTKNPQKIFEKTDH